MKDTAPGLETLEYVFPGQRPAGDFAPVLVEPASGSDCSIRIETSARGFGVIWAAVVRDFHARHPLAGLRVSINDMGATPAVVSLRLDQAISELTP